jgi:hypothetical protein
VLCAIMEGKKAAGANQAVKKKRLETSEKMPLPI